MGSIIKNQILKHLSKFTKNLNPDKINISTLKGEGELTNLELNEDVLMDVLDLPTWMKLTKAFCNKVNAKVQWTKLKSQPICLYLDEVVLEMETCPEPRPPNKSGQQTNNRSEGRYGFVDKVMDGIFIHINSVSVQFASDKFHASLQLSRVKVQSLTPTWAQPTDLRQSRIRSEPTDELLLFKEVDWSTTRIEANAREGETTLPTTPLRLIANQSKIRIVLKKRLSDCSVIASRIILLLDDLLWVLTDTQLKSAMMYANSLSTMIKKSSEQSKQLAAEKLKKQVKSGADQLYMQQQQQQRPRSQTNEAKFFQKYDVQTTSYHFITSRVDLHLCDDTPTDKGSSPKHNKKINGGAMQITICKLSIDYYPFHYADMDLILTSGGERKNWYRYSDNQGSRNSWVQELFKEFRAEASKVREVCKVLSPTQSPAHTPADSKPAGRSPQPNQNSQTAKGQGHVNGPASGQGQTAQRVTKLLESCMVLKIEEFIIYRVSTADNKRSTPQKFFSSDKKALHLPPDMSVVHVEYTDYFFTDGIDYPVPHSNMYVLINPVRLHIDYLTVLWANYFSLNLAQMVENQQNDVEKKVEHVDIKVEALMPRLVISAEEKVENQPDRPESLQIQFSKVTASNTHIENQFTLDDLQGLLSQYSDCDIFNCSEFPNDTDTLASIPKIFQAFADSRVNPYLCDYVIELLQGKLPKGFSETDLGTDAIKVLLKTNTLKRDMRCDMWGLCIDQVWLEFLGVPTSRTRPVPFVESFPLTLWICSPAGLPDNVVLPSNSKELVNGLPAGSSGTEEQQKEKRKTRQLLKQFYSEDDEGSPTDPKCENGFHSNCDNKNGDVQYTALKVADHNLVAKIGGKIRAQLNNPQYLFLMRLTESLTNFQAQLNADVEDFIKGDNSQQQSFSVPLVIPDLEFAMVCPYIAELLPLGNPVDILGSPNSESTDGREVCGDTDSDVQGYTVGPIGADMVDQPEQVLMVTHSNEGPHVEMTQSLHPDGHLPHSQSDSRIVCHIQTSESLDHIHQKGIRTDSHSSEDVTNSDRGGLEITGQSMQYTASDSGISSIGSSFAGQRSRSGSKLTPTSMRKSLTTGVSNISNFMGKLKNKLDPDDIDDCDTMSIRTDASDDDDFEFLGLDDTEAPAFSHGHISETSSVTDTDDLSSVFAESTSASRAKELVSAVVFRLSGTELLIQGVGEDLFVCLQTKAVDCEETGNISYEDFYAKLSSSNGVIRNPVKLQDGKYPIKFKMTLGPSAGRLVPKGSELGLMEARIRDYMFTFRMTSILNMTGFIEDEKVTIPTPMHVSVDNFSLTLLEDRPPPIPSHAEVSSQPINMNIQHMFIQRHDDGVFHMTTESSGSEESVIIPEMGIFKSETARDTVDNLDLTNIPKDIQNKIHVLENQNTQLKILCEKLDSHSQAQESEIEKLSQNNEQFEDIQSENKKLREKLKTFALSSGPSLDEMDDLRKVNSELEQDNNALMERVVSLEEDLKDMKREKESLLSTLQMMQEELIASEQYRQRTHSAYSPK